MELSDLEIKLSAAYEKHGREDLAYCVKNARVHQLLHGFFGEDLYSPAGGLPGLLSYLQALKTTLDPGSTHAATSLPEWDISAEMKYREDEGLEQVKKLDRERFKSKTRSEIVYPLQRAALRIWKGFLG
jgi:hypothetical protein